MVRTLSLLRVKVLTPLSFYGRHTSRIRSLSSHTHSFGLIGGEITEFQTIGHWVPQEQQWNPKNITVGKSGEDKGKLLITCGECHTDCDVMATKFAEETNGGSVISRGSDGSLMPTHLNFSFKGNLTLSDGSETFKIPNIVVGRGKDEEGKEKWWLGGDPFVRRENVHNKEYMVYSTLSESGFEAQLSATSVSNLFHLSSLKVQNDWMKRLADSLPISRVNIPGSHESGAISIAMRHPSEERCSEHDRQDYALSDQLRYGIRVIDARLHVVKGRVYISHGGHTYQDFASFLRTCVDFVEKNNSEFICMTIKNENSVFDESSMQTLKNTLSESSKHILLASDICPRVEQARGKVVLFNRISDHGDDNWSKDASLGHPLPYWEKYHNCPHKFIASCSGYRVEVQDYHDVPGFPKEPTKFLLWEKTVKCTNSNHGQSVVFNHGNFSSGKDIFTIKDKALHYLYNERPKYTGWTLFDFPFDKYPVSGSSKNIVDAVISSNFNYTE